ncbi:alpha/beta fold hydrolase [Anaerotignum sp. MB30-C6]|uniref:alpha/beta fold hydrolase n=1 Tax=Anaerotignum sp. MB30-C6 TaxID=3070814 RepID=UPI0027DC0D96|nr:alpha/beta fold hydrolase [Anaerotignum sp. MB30-C6]WMI80295.1 alpha/beta fold hydrolase [Anaerotignum sp. MB30-C6]
MKKEEFFISSTDHVNQLHVISWQGDGPIIAALQIVHGMVEFIDRYHEFAQYLCKNNIAVIGHDHLGHGLSVACDEDLGFFHETQGRKLLIQDIYQVTKEMKKQFPNVPHFILGHSMGSFCTRKYLTFYGHELQGAILVGTNNVPVALTKMGKKLANFLEKKHSSHYRSELLAKLAFASYLRYIDSPKTDKDWISRDKEIVSAYVAHKHCTFLFTVSAYKDMFSIIAYNAKKIRLDHIPRSLPILITSGEMDPVGDWGKGPKSLYKLYLIEGFEDVSLKLYPQGRHEIINELNRQEVYEDITAWILNHIS